MFHLSLSTYILHVKLRVLKCDENIGDLKNLSFFLQYSTKHCSVKLNLLINSEIALMHTPFFIKFTPFAVV